MMRRGKDARSPPSRQKRSLFSRSSSRAKDSPRKDSSLNPNSPLQMQGMMSHALSTPDPHRGVSSSPRSPTRAPSGFGSSSSTGRSPDAERHAELVERARDASNAVSLPLSDLKDDVTANGHFVDSTLCAAPDCVCEIRPRLLSPRSARLGSHSSRETTVPQPPPSRSQCACVCSVVPDSILGMP